ncbi:MAG TPA: PEP-CTERM sorting domain-containing protein [Myxococcota bacterium]|nr:PEP-CTERM sorting domain-containing protein [Myxococcota bacterium]
MRKWLLALVLAILGLGASAAQATTLGFTGFLAIQIATLAPVAVSGSGLATVGGAGNHVSSLSIPASPFSANGLIVPVTDPSAAPIAGIQATIHNGAGAFSGPGLVGAMAINGVTKVCLFAPCSVPPPANLSVPISVVGAGGVSFAGNLVNATVVGAPWTVGTALVGTLTAMGFHHGPASLSSSTAQLSGALRLVTPVFISTSIGASAVVPAFGILDLHFVPEPATLLLLGSGVVGLTLLGRSKRA